LFLARPFGSDSLLQRMITLSYSEDLKENKRKREQLAKQLNNPNLIKKIENYLNSLKIETDSSNP
jgi:hypothetical protein